MRLRFKPGLRVFVYSEAIDMRWGFSRLQALVAEQMKENLFQGHLFLFLGRNRRRAKLLLFDCTGLVLIIKRLDRNQFMSVTDLFSTREITQEDLSRLLDGASLRVTFAAAQRAGENLETA
jgi:transposase